VELDEEGRSAKVVVPEDQLSLAIGKKGQNVRLASRLTGWKIDVVGEAEHEHRKREELWASQDPAEVRERVYDLASELGIASKEAIDILREMGVNVSSHVSTIDGYTADDVRRRAKGDEAVRYGPRPEGMVPSSSDDERFDEELAAEPAEEIDDPDANADDDGAGEPPSPTEV